MNEQAAAPYTIERRIEIWNDATGAHIDIGPDRDGLDLIVIRQISSHGETAGTICLTQEEARLLSLALQDLRAPCAP